MDKTSYLYLMIAQTDTGIGSVIRTLSRFPYNHAALTLDPSLRRWVAFGRYIHNLPLYGGFINEPVERYLAKGQDIPVRIFRLEVTQEKYQQLEQLFSLAGNQDNGLLYNFYDLVANYFGQKIPIPGAYTCLGFACAVLEREFLSFRELNAYLGPYLYYDGTLSALVSDSGSRTDIYFSNIALPRAAWHSARHMAALAARTFRPGHTDIVAQQLRG